MYRNLRPLLFRLDAESAHSLILNLIRLAGVIPGLSNAIKAFYQAPLIPVEAFGLKFKNPIGLAAGYDKDGIGWRGLSLLGFGHVELGTVTPLPQSGNPRPRVFRLVQDGALINRMGFPGLGAEYLANAISGKRPVDLILGVNLGKNAATPFDSSIDDYLVLLKRFAGLADYLVINVSSPNTVGLRRLQARHELDKLLNGLVAARQDEEAKIKKKIPLLVKLSPDLSDTELENALDVIIANGIDGVVATNTTTSRGDVNTKLSSEIGGLSGRPLASVSTEVVRKINEYSKGNLPIIGVGGVLQTSDAQAKLEAGAKLIQVYTGLVYTGPGLVKSILEALSH
ncbi:MAG: quinone-dependent dihydroorotate dehydrogenase [Chloroflexi bacterium]|nr:quinone-dependent dihydroorotate dehydrogenase [Chloroflexota bacterium]